jgi:pimeloyl-ACP methyl ester carboxylesterase
MHSFNQFFWKSFAATALFLTLIACGKRAQVQPTVPPVTPTPQRDFAGLVNIGGRKMYLECRGTGSPIVILESGYRNDADIWSAQGEPGATMVLPGVSAITRVCAYDRPGTILDNTHFSRSNPVPMPRTAQDVVTDLHALLHAANIPGPYVLVGHSLGGLFVRLYASTYPDDVAGMVLVDAFSEWVRDGMTSDQWTLYKRFGFKDPPPGLVYKDLETIDVDISFDQMIQAKTAYPLRSIPLVVISKGLPFDLSPWQPLPADFPDALESAWKAAQEKLAALVPNTRHIVAMKSSHYVQIEQPALVIEAVRQVIGAVRAPSSWTVLSASPTPTP